MSWLIATTSRIRLAGARDALILLRMRAVRLDSHEYHPLCIRSAKLIVAVGRGHILPRRIGERFAGENFRRHLVTFPETGHNVPEEADPDCGGDIADWMSEAVDRQHGANARDVSSHMRPKPEHPASKDVILARSPA